MVYLNADHIITPLGEGVDANLTAIRQGETRLCLHEDVHGERLVEPVMASLLDESAYQLDGYSLFEALCIRTVSRALECCACDVKSNRTVFVLSSTKGDIWCSMAETAKHIATFFENSVSPIVVSTACTSGVSAQIAAWRLIESGLYDTAVVVGCDIQREFIVSGFQCFHALSNKLCMPFDKDREGLNAGEAVACMILSNQKKGLGWQLMGGSIHNDANHISGPSRTAEGSLRCLEDALKWIDKEQLGLVSVHGTGTAYNDEMESIAIYRAGLQDVPVTALKGYYGHTMGAAGLLETILSLHALNEEEILPTKGYHEQGTTYAVSLSNEVRHTEKRQLIKLLSGFGGVNSGVAWTIGEESPVSCGMEEAELRSLGEITIDASEDIVALYRQHVGDYPKFFKMDTLSRLGFVGVELLLQKVRETNPDFATDSEQCGLIIANRSASLKNDTDYQKTIEDKANYYPSPALFVYTLPNIVTGEIAIRHHLFGETACYILENEQELEKLIVTTFQTTQLTQAIVGWVECRSEKEYNAHLRLITKK